ncbi:hypothetical protein Tco_0067989 [Tanacetum coccineum]
MCKDDGLRVIRGILQRVKLLEQGLARTREMLLQINQGSFDATTIEEKMLLAQAQEARVALDEEQLAFLADTWERVDSGPDAQALTTTAIF